MVKLVKFLFYMVAMVTSKELNSSISVPPNVTQILHQTQSAAGSAMDWYTNPFFDDKFRQSVVQHGYVPSKGIPLKVFAGGPFEPASFREQAQFFPQGTEFNYYNQLQADASVRNISKKLEALNITGVYDAYAACRAKSFKSDIWRWAIMWDQGGIYLDAKFFFTQKPDWIDFQNEEFLLCGDQGRNFTRHSTGFIVMTQHHPAALAMLREISGMVNKRAYPKDVFFVTGPAALTKALNESNMVPHPHRCEVSYTIYNYTNKQDNKTYQAGIQEYMLHDQKFDRKRNCYLNTTANHTDECVQNLDEKALKFDRRVVRASRKDEKYGDVWIHMKTCKGCNEYGELHRKHQLYCDEPGEPCDISQVYEKDPFGNKVNELGEHLW